MRLGKVVKWPVLMALMDVEMGVLHTDFWYNLSSYTFMLQAIPASSLCRDVGTGVMEGALLNLSCCV